MRWTSMFLQQQQQNTATENLNELMQVSSSNADASVQINKLKYLKINC